MNAPFRSHSSGHLKQAHSYDPIATEYYDAAKHPTCRNFREASALYLRDVGPRLRLDGQCLEVGAGKSIITEFLSELSINLSNTILTDDSAMMLRYSHSYIPCGATLVISRAEALPMRDSSQDVIVASLGDPYNTSAFWNEVSRCLSKTGRCLFTTPSFAWAHQFRSESKSEKESLAFFELVDGSPIYVPSIIYRPSDQISLLHASGLAVEDMIDIPLRALTEPISKKLTIHPDLGVCHPVTGYLIRRL